MAHAQYRTLSKRAVDHLSVNGKDAVFGDHALAGFGARVYPSGKKVFVVQTRGFGRSKRVTLGTHGDITTETARKDPAAVIARIKKGQPAVQAEPEPAPNPTVADLADLAERYQRAHPKPAGAWMTGGPAATLGPACLQKFHQEAPYQQIAETGVWPKFS